MTKKVSLLASHFAVYGTSFLGITNPHAGLSPTNGESTEKGCTWSNVSLTPSHEVSSARWMDKKKVSIDFAWSSRRRCRVSSCAWKRLPLDMFTTDPTCSVYQ